jgi:hypothetical protein
MGMWDWLEQQYPAPGYSPDRASAFPPLLGPDVSALMRLVASGTSGNAPGEADDARAAQEARDAAAMAIARAVRPPEGRDEGPLTRIPEDWVRRMLRGPYSRYPAWPSPANPASPFPPPPSAAAPIDAPTEDEGGLGTQASREAAARTVANAARHPYGRIFEPSRPDNAPIETEDMRQAQTAREAWAQQLANAVRPKGPPSDLWPEAPAKIDEMPDAQAAYEAGARRIKNAVKPKDGRIEGKMTEEIVNHWPLTLLSPIMPAARAAGPAWEAAAIAFHTLIELLNSTSEAKGGSVAKPGGRDGVRQ